MSERREMFVNYAAGERRQRVEGPIARTLWAIFATVVLLVGAILLVLLPGVVVAIVCRTYK